MTNLVQALIGAAHGFVDVEAVATAARSLREPRSVAEQVHINGVLFGTFRRRLPILSSSETEQLVALVDGIGSVCQADVPAIVRDLRRLLRLEGPTKAEEIRDIIDRDFRKKLTSAELARAVDLGRGDAEAEFERRFQMSISEYVTRRRVHEGLARVRAGVKIEAAAREVGFKKGTRRFYAAVLKLTGTTPAAHRLIGRMSKPERERERERERGEGIGVC